MPSIFLSHATADKVAVKRLARDLRKGGVEVWMDQWRILVGTPIVQAIQTGLESTDYLAVWLTRRAVESRWVEREWQAKYYVEISSGRTAVLPLLAEDCDVPLLLREKRFADFRVDYNAGLQELVGAIGSSQPFSASLRMAVPEVVNYRLLGFPIQVECSSRGLFGRRKVVVLQRTVGEEEGIWHFQFEVPVDREHFTANGRVWFGTRNQGNDESHDVAAIIAPQEAKFRRQPGDLRLDLDDFDIVATCRVLRQDA